MSEPVLRLAVCGLHLKGQPLHSQLTDLHAVFIRTCLSVRFPSDHVQHAKQAVCRLAPAPSHGLHRLSCISRAVAGDTTQAEKYRLYAVGPPLTAPSKPGMIKMTSGSCIKVPMELYDLPLTNVGAFISKVGVLLQLLHSWTHAALASCTALLGKLQQAELTPARLARMLQARVHSWLVLCDVLAGASAYGHWDCGARHWRAVQGVRLRRFRG